MSRNALNCEREDCKCGVPHEDDHPRRCCDCFDAELLERPITDTCCTEAGCKHT